MPCKWQEPHIYFLIRFSVVEDKPFLRKAVPIAFSSSSSSYHFSSNAYENSGSGLENLQHLLVKQPAGNSVEPPPPDPRALFPVFSGSPSTYLSVLRKKLGQLSMASVTFSLSLESPETQSQTSRKVTVPKGLSKWGVRGWVPQLRKMTLEAS